MLPGQFSIVTTMIALRHGLVKVVPFCFMTYRKKLIEVTLPLNAISEAEQEIHLPRLFH